MALQARAVHRHHGSTLPWRVYPTIGALAGGDDATVQLSGIKQSSTDSKTSTYRMYRINGQLPELRGQWKQPLVQQRHQAITQLDVQLLQCPKLPHHRQARTGHTVDACTSGVGE